MNMLAFLVIASAQDVQQSCHVNARKFKVGRHWLRFSANKGLGLVIRSNSFKVGFTYN